MAPVSAAFLAVPFASGGGVADNFVRAADGAGGGGRFIPPPSGGGGGPLRGIYTDVDEEVVRRYARRFARQYIQRLPKNVRGFNSLEDFINFDFRTRFECERICDTFIQNIPGSRSLRLEFNDLPTINKKTRDLFRGIGNGPEGIEIRVGDGIVNVGEPHFVTLIKIDGVLTVWDPATRTWGQYLGPYLERVLTPINRFEFDANPRF
jgi:hypothetical protein